jgi:double-stranded uracil-DNA glycosylase
MRETNPFKMFYPKNAKYLIVGSFPSINSKKGWSYDWYYSNGRNQFWRILEAVYGVDLKTKEQQQKLFTNLAIAITDIILSCERSSISSLDAHLINIEYNVDAITKVLKSRQINTVLVTSRFVEKLFKKVFTDLLQELPELELITLPSPSPRYALMSFKDKVKRYSEVLPKKY